MEKEIMLAWRTVRAKARQERHTGVQQAAETEAKVTTSCRQGSKATTATPQSCQVSAARPGLAPQTLSQPPTIRRF